MKLFTKITLIASGLLFVTGAVCLLIAGSMGFTVGNFRQMVYDGKFSFDIDDLDDLDIFDSNDFSNVSSHSDSVEITEEFTHLEIEYGAGTLTILYDNIDHILIETKNIRSFKADVDDNILTIKGNADFNGIADTSHSELVITLPRDASLESVDLEIGASDANITELSAEAIDIEIGAGQATLDKLTADKLDISVGAGQADISMLDAQSFNAEVGVGELNASLIGDEDDYNYKIDCGIGSVEIGNKSYDGLGDSHTVENDGSRSMDIDCGIGDVDIEFIE